MRRIFDDYAYGSGPRDGCWWDETCPLPEVSVLDSDIKVDVAIIGGGYTGLSAARHLALQGTKVAVLEAHFFGWGASGRNGGFCCLGGGKSGDAELDARYGRAARLDFRRAEKDAVACVEAFITSHDLDVDRHSDGETTLAHRPKDMADLHSQAAAVVENYGVEPMLIEKPDLPAHGIGGGPFHGGMSIPIGFGLNPRKYMRGLITAAESAGVLLFGDTPVTQVSPLTGGHRLHTPRGAVAADQVIVATNGYSSEDMPPELAGRYMPAQSTVLVTRPLSDAELAAQGWTSDQMSYDTRRLLHYFRLMPDRRFLFGKRGALLTGARAEASARASTRADFERMFPAWSQVNSDHSWSGMVSLARNKLPFVAEIPRGKGIWAAMCYHGNGVAMGSYAGQMVADLILDRNTEAYPSILQGAPARFPLGAARRCLMPPLYAGLKLRDSF